MRFTSLLLAFSLAIPLAAQTTLIERGREALRNGDSEAAVSLFRRAVGETPQNSEAHYWLGVAYGREARKASRVNMLRQARLAMRTRDEFERAVELDPNNVQARFALVEFYTLAPMFLGGGGRKAMQQAAEIAARDPSMGHEALAFIDSAAERYHDAAGQLEEAVKLNPANMPAWFEIGRVAAITGSNLTRGQEALQKYLGITPRPDEDEPPLSRAFYFLGLIYEKRGRAEEARQSYAESLRLDPAQKDVREAIAHAR